MPCLGEMLVKRGDFLGLLLLFFLVIWLPSLFIGFGLLIFPGHLLLQLLFFLFLLCDFFLAFFVLVICFCQGGILSGRGGGMACLFRFNHSFAQKQLQFSKSQNSRLTKKRTHSNILPAQGEVAQRQSKRLIIARSWVQIPPSPHQIPLKVGFFLYRDWMNRQYNFL